MGTAVMIALGIFMKSPKSLIFIKFQKKSTIVSISMISLVPVRRSGAACRDQKKSKNFLVIGVDSCQKPPGIVSERPQWPPRPPQPSQSAPHGSSQKRYIKKIPYFIGDSNLATYLCILLDTQLPPTSPTSLRPRTPTPVRPLYFKIAKREGGAFSISLP